MAPLDLDDADPLEQPIEEEFRAGTMTLSWDPAVGRVVIEVFPFSDEVVVVEETGEDTGEEIYVEPDPRRCCWCASPRAPPARSRCAPAASSRRGDPDAPSAAAR